MVFSTLLVFLPAWYVLTPLGNHGPWLAFMLFMASRGIGVHYATATTTHIVVADVGRFSTPDCPPPPVSDEEPYDFILSKAPHGQMFISNFVETRYSPDSSRNLGPNTMWMRTPPLLSTENTTPFQHVCTLADCGNAISCNHKMTEVSCVNPDITIALPRLPETDWLASRAISHWQGTGIGVSHATLFDEAGEIGYAIQSLVLRRL